MRPVHNNELTETILSAFVFTHRARKYSCASLMTGILTLLCACVLFAGCSKVGLKKDRSEQASTRDNSPESDSTQTEGRTKRTVVTLPEKNSTAERTGSSSRDGASKGAPADQASNQRATRKFDKTRGWIVSSIDDHDTSPIVADSDAATNENEDDPHAPAIDDETRQKLDLAAEYYSMGLVANQQAKWEEAQFYLERSLKLLASADIVADNDTLPVELQQYGNLLDNVVAAYHVTLLSLGQLPADASPSALIEKFSSAEKQLLSLPEDSLNIVDRDVTYDMPIKFNERVRASIRYFQNDARKAFIRYYSRSTKYLPVVKEIIRSYGLPEDLSYLPIVESGFNPEAYSWAKALGMWQFIYSTGKLYDLERTWWYDERRDPIKSTHAACRFFKDLYDKFGDWEVCLAAYNGGPGRLERALKKERADDFWDLKRLRRETHNYVPLFMAATIISKNPQKYGFDMSEFSPEPVLTFDEVETYKCLDLDDVAKALDCSADELAGLNPELLRGQTPPDATSYRFRIPAGKQGAFLAAYESLESPQANYAYHKVRRGESMKTIARRYGVTSYAIQESNNLRSTKLIAGQTLVIPVPDRSKSGGAASDAMASKRTTKSGSYVVRRGDSIYEIARDFNVAIDDLRNANKLGRRSRIYVGERLSIPGQGSDQRDALYSARERGGANDAGSDATMNDVSDDYLSHTVKRGENLTAIAQKYGVTVTQLREWNGLSRAQTIFPSQRLKIASTDVTRAIISKSYTVRRGDTLAKIARQFGVTVADLKSWNDVPQDGSVNVGATLKLAPNEGQKLSVSSSAKVLWHTVRRGENLSDIASHYDISIDKIVTDNRINNPGLIKAGDRLKIKAN